MKSCYAVCPIVYKGKDCVLAAPEGHGAAKLFYLVFERRCEGAAGKEYGADVFAWETLWREPGGTLSLVPLNKKEWGVFLATQNSFPAFDAKHAVLVRGKHYNDAGWVITPFLHMPYLHRFDIIRKNGEEYLILCTLCDEKKDVDDWSKPGRVLVGTLSGVLEGTEKPTCIMEGLKRNHGFCSLGDRALAACDDGIFEVCPPDGGEGWKIRRVTGMPVGDVAVCDIDEDGREEYFVITPFHGSCFQVLKDDGDSLVPAWEYSDNIEFGHVAWGGRLRGKPAFIGGSRGGNGDLFCITYEQKRGFLMECLDHGSKPTNICVINREDMDIVVAANRAEEEIAAYIITD